MANIIFVGQRVDNSECVKGFLVGNSILVPAIGEVINPQKDRITFFEGNPYIVYEVFKSSIQLHIGDIEVVGNIYDIKK